MRSLAVGCVFVCVTYSREIVTAGLDSLNEEAARCRIAVHCTDEVLHGRFMRQTDQIPHMVHCQPRQMFWIMQVLTLRYTGRENEGKNVWVSKYNSLRETISNMNLEKLSVKEKLRKINRKLHYIVKLKIVELKLLDTTNLRCLGLNHLRGNSS